MKSWRHPWYVYVIGWIGTILLFIAFALNAWGIIESTGIFYGLSNFIAAIFLGIRVYADRNWSNLVLEIFWMIIATIGIVRYLIV